MILGYTIIEPDLNSEMLDGIQLHECAKYGNIYDLNFVNPRFKMKNKKYNISGTYDGFTIVNGEFKQIKICPKFQ